MKKNMIILVFLLIPLCIVEAQENTKFRSVQSQDEEINNKIQQRRGRGPRKPKRKRKESINIKSPHGDLLMRRQSAGDNHWKRALTNSSNQLTINFNGDYKSGVYVGGSKLFTHGNMGVGINNPSERFEVRGSIRMHSGEIKDSGPMEFKADDNYSNDRIYKFFGYANANNHSGDSDYVVFDAKNEKNTVNGKTIFNMETTFIGGIKGDLVFKGNVLAAKDFTIGKNFNFIGNINFNAPSTTQRMNVTSGLQISLKNSNANNTFKIGSIAGANALYVANNGKIGMGTDTPSERLQVDGKVKASGFVADASAFPDYVFANDYELTPLSKVKEFVTTNKHLPNMPTEKEVITNGLDLKKVTTVSVEKIEELYLYTIKQQELIEKQQKTIEELQELVQEIKQKIK